MLGSLPEEPPSRTADGEPRRHEIKVRLLPTSQRPRTESTSTCLTASSFARLTASVDVACPVLSVMTHLSCQPHTLIVSPRSGDHTPGGGAADPCASGHCAGR